MGSIFPHELIDYTVDYLYDDPTSLKACSLVSRPFLPSTRMHLFHRVTLAPTPIYLEGRRMYGKADNIQRRFAQMRGRCQRLYSVLLASPGIAQYVRELTIVDARGFPGMEPIGWMKDEETLPFILYMFDRVEILAFQSIAEWGNHTPDLHGAIRNLLRLPSLRSLSLIQNGFLNFSAMATLLSNVCPHLKCLKIDRNYYRDQLGFPDKLLEAPSSERARLEELDVYSFSLTTDRIIEWLLHPSSHITVVSSLRVLRVVNLNQTPCTNKFLDQVGDSIEHLKFMHSSSREPLEVPTIDVNKTPNLRTLQLHFAYFATDTMPFDLKAFLDPSSIFMHLESIIIEILTEERRLPGLMALLDLGEIEDILIGGNFPALSSVEFRFLQKNQSGPIPAHLLDAWQTQLPKLRERGILIVQNL